jgi:peptide/nickel transport system permease protein
MTAYIVRRCLYAIPILLGVNVIVFLLFFFVNSPDDMARTHLGQKRVTPEQIDQWKREHSLDLPYFYNAGWRRIGAVVATKAENTAEFLTAGEGNYALTIEAPPGPKTAQPRVAESRTVRIESNQPERLTLPAEFAAQGTLRLPATTTTQQFAFRIAPTQTAGQTPPTLRLTLTVEAPAPTQRVVLAYQAPIALLSRFTDTVFFQRSLRMLFFQYGKSDDGKIISEEVSHRIGPSLTITLPAFLLALLIDVFFAMIVAVYRGTYVDYWSIILCVLLMSVSGLFYIIGGQAIFAKTLRLVPISGFDYGSHALKFALLPVLISIVSGLGGSVRFYRTIFLEEISKDYVRTARAKGLPERRVLFVHALKNAMIPILTSVVVSLPFLFAGSLLLESFFAIPGMGSYMIDAIQRQDFAVVQAMVSLGSFLYVVGLLMTDISYTLVDPRVRLE